MSDITKFNTEDYVAHYTRLETVIEYILPSNKIKINSIRNMNDPYENKMHWIDIDGLIDDKKLEESFQIKRDLKNILSNSIKIFASTHYEENKDYAGLSSHIYCRPRMRAQYGNNHKGVCLIFNKQKLDCFKKSSNISKYIRDKVEYLPCLNTENDFDVDSYIKAKEYIEDKNKLFDDINKNEFIKSRFFKKHDDWKGESEYRWIVLSDDKIDLFIDFEDSLEAIVLGCDVHLQYHAIFKKAKIPVYDLNFRDDKYNANRVTFKG